MSRFGVLFDTDGAAFDDGFEGRSEVQTILRTLAERVWNSDDEEGLIRDSNGNTVGSWRYERDEE